MKRHDAGWVCQQVAGTLVGDSATQIGPAVVIDSRKATPGSLFVAFEGENVDGHDFAQDAVNRGAAAVLVTKKTEVSVPQIIVDEIIEALSELAKALVKEAKAAGLKVIGVTGSSGKTSTKDILAQLLRAAGETVSPVGSFNNEIGLPITACQVVPSTKYLVTEMGSRGLGHVAALCDITPPDVSLVVNVGTAHLGEFGSQEVIAQAKGEIVEALDETGWAVLNLNDPLVKSMAAKTKARIAWFGTGDVQAPQDAELVVIGRHISLDDLARPTFEIEVSTPRTQFGRKISMQLSGSHMVMNAVAAVAAAVAAGVPVDQVTTQLGEVSKLSPMRMDVTELKSGAALIDDSYNANPDSMAAAISNVGRMGVARKRHYPKARTIGILGDMLELGDNAATFHYKVGEQAAEAGFDVVIAVGDFASDILAGAQDHSLVIETHEAKTHQEAADAISLRQGDVILVKASRGIALDKVAELLRTTKTKESTSQDVAKQDGKVQP